MKRTRNPRKKTSPEKISIVKKEMAKPCVATSAGSRAPRV